MKWAVPKEHKIISCGACRSKQLLIYRETFGRLSQPMHFFGQPIFIED